MVIKPLSLDDPEHWRRRAIEIRTIVSGTIDLVSQAILLRIAADFDRLAEIADKRERQRRGRQGE
jgi:hypothetical protein